MKLPYFFQSVKMTSSSNNLDSEFGMYVEQSNLRPLLDEFVNKCFEGRTSQPKSFIGKICSSATIADERLKKENLKLKNVAKAFKNQSLLLQKNIDKLRERLSLVLRVERNFKSLGTKQNAPKDLQSGIGISKSEVQRTDTLPLVLSPSSASPPRKKARRRSQKKLVVCASSLRRLNLISQRLLLFPDFIK